MIGANVKSAQNQLSKEHLQVTVLGSGKTVRRQSLAANSSTVMNNRIILATDGKVKMPNVQGWSQSDVSQLANMLNLQLNVSGNGFVTKQSIKENATVKTGQTLTVQFEEE